MQKYSFRDDYSEFAHPEILKIFNKNTTKQLYGYGEDVYTEQARKIIGNEIQSSKADIHFVAGGTLANLVIISAALRPHESVIAAQTGHIATHEAGAIEATGHKVNTILSKDGKITPGDIQKLLDEHNVIPHMVKPKMVYISNTTEIGSVYTKKELESISSFCRKKELLLYLDGARLGVALTSKHNDLNLADIARLTDIFYIGGTKNGSFPGEAIVINNKQLQKDFAYHLKQKGALTSKGFYLSLPFIALFKNGLYYNIATRANKKAEKLVDILISKNYSFLIPPESNQIFPILPNTVIELLLEKFDFHTWKIIDENHTAIRLVTSWTTDENILDTFSNILPNNPT